ncbi:MAG: DUF72 domain-containing protein [Actinobacteria bacterium]|nr:DUF72 domain-containing protein [Actinomycetota bacterium]
MAVLVGTSGWQYKDWRGRFYPDKLAQGRWLEHYSERFSTVEVNNTFYRLPKPETFGDWRARVPNDFVYAVKASRYLTHILRLKDPGPAVKRFLDASKPMGPRLGPVLVQLPPNLQADHARLRDTLSRFPKAMRVTVEFRHDSWFTDETAELLAEFNSAWCMADRKSRPLGPVRRTADWGYLRFHEGTAKPWPHYGDRALAHWAERLADLFNPADDVFVYFNNDPGCWAVADAITFARRLERVGLRPTPVPSRDETMPVAA